MSHRGHIDNIGNAYTAVSKLHFGKCYHLAILLQPTYTKRLKADPVTVRTVKMWTDNAMADLFGDHRCEHF